MVRTTKVKIEVEDNALKIKELITEAVSAFLYEAGGELLARIIRNSRTDTGLTKGSYEYRVVEKPEESMAEVHVGSALENAIWEEYGTGEYALNGDGRKGKWRYKDPKGNWHTTSGKKPNKPVARAYRALRKPLEERLGEIIKEKIGGGR